MLPLVCVIYFLQHLLEFSRINCKQLNVDCELCAPNCDTISICVVCVCVCVAVFVVVRYHLIIAIRISSTHLRQRRQRSKSFRCQFSFQSFAVCSETRAKPTRSDSCCSKHDSPPFAYSLFLSLSQVGCSERGIKFI